MARTSGAGGRARAALLPGLVLAAGAAGLAGCENMAVPGADKFQSLSDTFAVKVPFLIPPRSAEAGQLRSMSLVPTDATPMTGSVAAEIESALLKVRMAEQPYYTRVRLEPAARAADDASLGAFAARSGSQGAVGVSGAAGDVRTASVTEERKSCNVGKKWYEECPGDKTTINHVTCTETRATASAHVRVVRASDLRTVFTQAMSGTSAYRVCTDQRNTRPGDRNELMASAMRNLAANVAQVVAPTFEDRPLDLMSADAPIAGEMRKSFEAAFGFARAKRLDEACARFGQLYDDFKESVALIYNVAYCAEARGDLLRANQGYRRASELANAPVAQVDRHLAATEKLLKEMPVAFTPGAQPFTVGAGANATPVLPLSGRREALVIGNARYQRAQLINPVNDARLTAERLKKLGFNVLVVENVDGARLHSAVRDFGQRAKGADAALFYYAGHAVQYDGDNLLIPVDNARMRDEGDVRSGGGLPLSDVVAQLDVARPRVKLIVLDACRDSPLPGGANRSRGLGGGGLAEVKKPPEGMLIAFATAPGRTAEDGTGRNSVFTKHFVNALSVPNLTVEQIFKRVREGVRSETGNRQEPMETNSLTGEFYFLQSAS